jgi:hypothetical protein
MFPIGDDNSARRSVPVVTYVLIVLNLLFFLVELSGGDAFVMQCGSSGITWRIALAR